MVVGGMNIPVAVGTAVFVSVGCGVHVGSGVFVGLAVYVGEGSIVEVNVEVGSASAV